MNKYNSMTNQQLIDEFNLIYKSSCVSRSNINKYVKNHYNELYQEIEKRTIKLNHYKHKCSKNGKLRDISIFERLYCLQKNLNDRPFCIECQTQHVANFIIHKNCYAEYCSQNCQRHSSIQINKGLEKKRQIYGEDNITNNKKAHQTRLERYGQYHPEEFSKKVKATKKKKHGNENYVNVEKMLKTVEKHKQENPNYYLDREKKTKETKIRNGHDANWNNRKKFKETLSHFSDERKNEIKEKRKQTNIENYGYEYAMQNPEIRSKASSTCYDLYGVTCPLNTEKAKDAANYAIRQKAWRKFIARNARIEPMFTEKEFIEYNSHEKLWRWRCKKCGHEFMRAWKNLNVHCPECFLLNYHGLQDEVYDYVMSICTNDLVKKNDRKTFSNKFELDILNETQNIAIEFNGLAWHNVDKKIYDSGRPITMMYHYDKTSKCEEKNIRLIHIFEDEWLENKMLCKSKLKKILAPISVMKIDASLCNIDKNIGQDEKDKLLNKYTFFGYDGSSIAYALRLRGKIVAMMTFSKTRKDKAHEWQILNYVEMNAFIVKNGFKILMNEFCNDNAVNSISFYLSRDWNTASDIDCMDFANIKLPHMYWVKKFNRVKDIDINMKNIYEFIDIVDNSKSLAENMKMNGFSRLYDSGVLMFEKSNVYNDNNC